MTLSVVPIAAPVVPSTTISVDNVVVGYVRGHGYQVIREKLHSS